ncbi:hypothetical protein GF366_03165 [Candidatus Peregrinibacteria bacterium]|nr:hypothetical protein [Candidatus Peregrinibacteria bacterium]
MKKTSTIKKVKKTISLLLVVLTTLAFIGPSTVFAATWIQQEKLTAGEGSSDDYFGSDVSISGNYAVVGAYNYDNGTTRGIAYVYERADSTWTKIAKLTASDAADNDAFGISVSIDSDYIIVGAVGEDGTGIDHGAAYIFEKPAGGGKT